jgi:hypothetical protein
VTFDRCTFRNTVFENCDFYGAHFRDNNLLGDAKFVATSLTLCALEGTRGFTYANVPSPRNKRWRFGDAREPGLIQQACVQKYSAFLDRIPAAEAQVRSAKALDDRLREAADAYRYFAGVWTSQGALADAAASYAAAQRLERHNASPIYRFGERLRHKRTSPAWRRPESARRGFLWIKRSFNWIRRGCLVIAALIVSLASPRIGRWLFLWIGAVIADFGNSLQRVLVCLLIVAFAPGIGFRLFGGVDSEKVVSYRLDQTTHIQTRRTVENVCGLGDCLLFSVGRLTTTNPDRLKPTTRSAELIDELQPILGVALLGLFGFVLGNKLRGE